MPTQDNGERRDKRKKRVKEVSTLSDFYSSFSCYILSNVFEKLSQFILRKFGLKSQANLELYKGYFKANMKSHSFVIENSNIHSAGIPKI